MPSAPPVREPPIMSASVNEARTALYPAGTSPIAATAPARIASIDALRGFDMLCIVSIYRIGLALGEMLSGQGPALTSVGDFITRQFEHAPWEGLRFYDLLYPLFLFIVGVVIPLSITRLV
jgi:predicted acyltransferase